MAPEGECEISRQPGQGTRELLRVPLSAGAIKSWFQKLPRLWYGQMDESATKYTHGECYC